MNHATSHESHDWTAGVSVAEARALVGDDFAVDADGNPEPVESDEGGE